MNERGGEDLSKDRRMTLGSLYLPTIINCSVSVSPTDFGLSSVCLISVTEFLICQVRIKPHISLSSGKIPFETIAM